MKIEYLTIFLLYFSNIYKKKYPQRHAGRPEQLWCADKKMGGRAACAGAGRGMARRGRYPPLHQCVVFRPPVQDDGNKKTPTRSRMKTKSHAIAWSGPPTRRTSQRTTHLTPCLGAVGNGKETDRNSKRQSPPRDGWCSGVGFVLPRKPAPFCKGLFKH